MFLEVTKTEIFRKNDRQTKMSALVITLIVGVVLGMYTMTIPGVKPATEKLTGQMWAAISKATSDYAKNTE